jgi:GntR family carbon starvation induced transcriptional regulator
MKSDDPTLSQTYSTELVAQLRRAIINGELQPGAKLKLEPLRKELALTQSRSPLREALSRLSAEGWILIEDQRGYRVAPISAAHLRQVAKLRVHMETLALRESIVRGDRTWEEEIVDAEASLASMPRGDEKARNLQEAWETAHQRFHFALLRACDMPMLIDYCVSLHDHNARYRRMFLKRNPFDRDVKSEHKAMLEAALERNPDLACALLAQHIERTTRNILIGLSTHEVREGARRSDNRAAAKTKSSPHRTGTPSTPLSTRQ